MAKQVYWKWILAGFAVLALSRVVIIFGYERYWTDVGLYHEAASYAVRKGFRAYHDFWFPYPPMSLPLIYAPMLFASEISAYRHAFQLEMLLFDFGSAAYLALFLRNRLSASPKRVFFALTLYAAFGMLMGHLIYDRLDIVIAFFLIASVYHFTDRTRPAIGRCVSYLLTLCGALVKFVPLLWAPVFVLAGFFRGWPRFSRTRSADSAADNSSDPEAFRMSTANFAGAIPSTALVYALFALVIFAYDAATYNEQYGKGLLTIMSEHGARGIQMESLWATPMIISNLRRGALGEAPKYHLESNYGAQHYKNSELPRWYLVSAKFAGFAGLGLFYAALFFLAARRRYFRELFQNPIWIQSTALAALLFVITTQRVLSPQYFLWVMPASVLFVFSARRFSLGRLLLFSAIFALTYVEFDICYESLTKMETSALSALLARNALLVLATVLALVSVFKASGDRLIESGDGPAASSGNEGEKYEN